MAGTSSPSIVDGDIETGRGVAFYDDVYDVAVDHYDTQAHGKAAIFSLGSSPKKTGSSYYDSGNGASSTTRLSFLGNLAMFLFSMTIYFCLVFVDI